MKKLFIAMLLSVCASISFAQISQKDKNYMFDLGYIEGQLVKDEVIEKNIKRQPVLADYFAIAIRKNEIILVPYANDSLLEVKTIIEGWKNTLNYDVVNYESEKMYGKNRIKIHLVYTKKPKWVTSTIFD